MTTTYKAFLLAVLVVIVGAVWYTTSSDAPKAQEPAGSVEPTAGESARVEARIGEDVHVFGETLTVVRITEDSRCPQGVQCIQAGTVRGEGTIRGGMGLGQVNFELGKTSTSEVNTFTLVEVRPAPVAGESIGSGEYVLVFDVTRRSVRDLQENS